MSACHAVASEGGSNREGGRCFDLRFSIADLRLSILCNDSPVLVWPFSRS
jgi:hypothetical protein